ncbi:MAG TPA: DUF3592 domain-containing protein [Candidatus Polarisedimenticolaceae bacterium]|nr:DUF3592 domain-containing protein [Candidatus Polarisedimenticolaceae bacterium]
MTLLASSLDETSSPISPVSQIAIGLVLIIFGTLSVAGAVIGRRRALQSRHWLETEAEIVDTYVDADHFPKVRYRYQLDGNTFEGTRLAIFERGYGLRSSARRVLMQYQVGQRIPVWVNPNDHGDAVLRRGGHGWAALGFLLGGLAFGAFGVLLIASVWRSWATH